MSKSGANASGDQSLKVPKSGNNTTNKTFSFFRLFVYSFVFLLVFIYLSVYLFTYFYLFILVLGEVS